MKVSGSVAEACVEGLGGESSNDTGSRLHRDCGDS